MAPAATRLTLLVTLASLSASPAGLVAQQVSPTSRFEDGRVEAPVWSPPPAAGEHYAQEDEIDIRRDMVIAAILVPVIIALLVFSS